MFQVKRFFASKPKARKNDNPFFICECDEIRKVLAAVSGPHKVVTLYFPGLPGDGYASSLAEIGKGDLLFDRLASDEGHAGVMKRRTFRALAKYRGVTITFDCRLKELVSREEKTWYRVTFPERIYYPQKRDFFRLHVSFLNLPVRISGRSGIHPETSDFLGVIDDIGLDGMAFIIDPVMHFRKFDVVWGCSFDTSAGDTIVFSLEVRSVRKLRNGSKIRVGGRYKNLSARNRLRIQKELLWLQRRIREQESEEVLD